MGIDSDGTVFDSMKIKHCEAFIPTITEIWNADIIIAGVCNAILFENQISMINELVKTGKTVIVIAMESPCDISVLPQIGSYICTFGAARAWMEYAADIIFGISKGNAISPIDMSPYLRKQEE